MNKQQGTVCRRTHTPKGSWELSPANKHAFRSAPEGVSFCVPKDEYVLNWQFRIRPHLKVRAVRGECPHVYTYSLTLLDSRLHRVLHSLGRSTPQCTRSLGVHLPPNERSNSGNSKSCVIVAVGMMCSGLGQG